MSRYRRDPELLLARVCLVTGVPGAFSKTWIDRHVIRGEEHWPVSELRRRRLIATWRTFSVDSDRSGFYVGPHMRTCLGLYRCLNVEQIGVHDHGRSGFSRMIITASTLSELETWVRGIEAVRDIAYEVDQLAKRRAWDRRRDRVRREMRRDMAGSRRP